MRRYPDGVRAYAVEGTLLSPDGGGARLPSSALVRLFTRKSRVKRDIINVFQRIMFHDVLVLIESSDVVTGTKYPYSLRVSMGLRADASGSITGPGLVY